MSQDLRLYFLSLLVVLMLYAGPTHAAYNGGGQCPALAVPVQLDDGDIWHGEDWEGPDYRDLYPVDTGNAFSSGRIDDQDCVVEAYAGNYYDGANHLWVLDDDLWCENVYGNPGDFRAGNDY